MEKINRDMRGQKMKNPCEICENKEGLECICDKKMIYNIERRNVPRETIPKKFPKEDEKKS